MYYRAVFKGVKAPLFVLHYSSSETSLLTPLWQSGSARIFFVPTIANGSGKTGNSGFVFREVSIQVKNSRRTSKTEMGSKRSAEASVLSFSGYFQQHGERSSPRIAPTNTSGMKPVKSFSSLVLNTCPVVKYTITHVSSVLWCVHQ